MATREEIAEVYVATYNRAADANGLAYWDGSGIPEGEDGAGAKTGLTNLEEIASAMLSGPEVIDMYGDPSAESFDRESFVIKLYDNILNKTVDGTDEGVQYWVASTDISISKMIIALINGAKSESGDPVDKATLANKLEVGIAFADAGLNDITKSKSVMIGVDSDHSSVESAKSIIASISGSDIPDDDSTVSIPISADGTTTASDAITEIFDISTDSTYSHTILDFDISNDKLNFGKGVTASDLNLNNTADDGEVELSYAIDAGETVVTITLAGLTSAEDVALTETRLVDDLLV
jgi:hypothetical protein